MRHDILVKQISQPVCTLELPAEFNKKKKIAPPGPFLEVLGIPGQTRHEAGVKNLRNSFLI